MPTNHKSPFASPFKSAVKHGTPCGVAVNNIAKNSKKSPKVVFESLFKAGLCFRQKFNGQFVYWTSEKCKKGTATHRNECQNDMWQSFIDWCISSGFCTPEQLMKHCGSQKEFMTFCRKFFAKQFGTTTGTKKRTSTKAKKRKTTTKARKRTTTKTSKRKTTRKPTASRKTTVKRGSYKFPTAKRRSSTRRYRRAA